VSIKHITKNNMINGKLVIVGRGLLGQALASSLADYQPCVLTHADLDITNHSEVERVLTPLMPSVIINAAAYTKVDQCETERELALQVNGQAPGCLAAVAKQLGAKFVHFSTDYIFSGDKVAGYSETATDFAPINVYGESKLVGEQAIQDVAGNSWHDWYIVRTAWLYGHGGTNFVDTMINLATQRNTLKVVNDQHGSPTFVQDLAVQTRYLLEHNLPGGMYHCTNSGYCTWFEFAATIFKLTQQAVTVAPCTSAEFPRPARRPEYSILLNTKLPAMRPWREALSDYIQQRPNPPSAS
jgi:dTDP-4-dehydrorhamnose reductase